MYYQELSSAKYFQEDESATVATLTPPSSTKESDDPWGTRALVIWAIFIPVAMASYYTLPFVQSLSLPQAAGGVDGPWLLRPSLAGRFLGSACIAGITAFLGTIRLRRNWRVQDALAGRPLRLPDRYPIFKVLIYLMFLKYLLLSGTFLLLYLCSWCAISARGIEVRMPWGTKNYSFAQVATLRLESRAHLPVSNPNDKFGYDIQFADGDSWYFTLKNEGLSETELNSIVTFLAQQTGKQWRLNPVNNGRQR